jgi:hypothetical protein
MLIPEFFNLFMGAGLKAENGRVSTNTVNFATCVYPLSIEHDFGLAGLCGLTFTPPLKISHEHVKKARKNSKTFGGLKLSCFCAPIISKNHFRQSIHSADAKNQ